MDPPLISRKANLKETSLRETKIREANLRPVYATPVALSMSTLASASTMVKPRYLRSFLFRRPGQPSIIARTPLSARPSPLTPTSAHLSPMISRNKSPSSILRDSQDAKSIRTLTLPPPRRDGLSDARVSCRDADCTQDPHPLPLTDTVPDSFFVNPHFKCSS